MQTISLLLIDDNITFLGGLRRFLDAQHVVEVAGELESSRDVLGWIDTLHPDVVVTDLAMPEVSGFTVIDQIHNAYPEIGVVALSMYDDREYRDGALKTGAHAFVMKSKLKEELIQAVVQAFETAKKNDERLNTADKQCTST